MTKDPTHIPENVQAVLKALPVKDQVVLRAYIAGLREHVKELEQKLLTAEDGDEHAHYHGKKDAPPCRTSIMPPTYSFVEIPGIWYILGAEPTISGSRYMACCCKGYTSIPSRSLLFSSLVCVYFRP